MLTEFYGTCFLDLYKKTIENQEVYNAMAKVCNPYGDGQDVSPQSWVPWIKKPRISAGVEMALAVIEHGVWLCSLGQIVWWHFMYKIKLTKYKNWIETSIVVWYYFYTENPWQGAARQERSFGISEAKRSGSLPGLLSDWIVRIHKRKGGAWLWLLTKSFRFL